MDSASPATAECIALIGASGGIGSALLELLASRGAAVFCGGRDQGRLDSALTEVRRRHPGARVAARSVDARDSAQVDAFLRGAVEFATAEGLELTGAASLAGSIVLKPAHLATDADWNETFAQNASSAFHLLRAAARVMLAKPQEDRRPRGSIVLMSSVAAGTGLVNHEPIAAAKGAVEGLVRSAAATYAGRGIRVNGVAPGLVETPLAARIISNEAALKASVAMHPMKRIGNAGDIAAGIAFLLHPTDTAWMTGQILSIDGGLGRLKAAP